MPLTYPDIEKQGDFFVESPIILLAGVIWYLKIYKNGVYCTFPHAIELLNKPYADLFTILTSYPELETIFHLHGCVERGSEDQLQGQDCKCKIPLTEDFTTTLLGNDG